MRKPAIYFPGMPASKMAIAGVLGSLFLLVGGVILSTMIFNTEMQKRQDYRP